MSANGGAGAQDECDGDNGVGGELGLLAAATLAGGGAALGGRKRPRGSDASGSREQHRRDMNRENARKSRQRKKVFLESLVERLREVEAENTRVSVSHTRSVGGGRYRGRRQGLG